MNLETVKTYIKIIDPRLLNQITGKPKAFISLLQKRKFESEEDFIKALCKNRYSRKYYSELKRRALIILENLILVTGSHGVSTVQKKI